MPYPEMSPDFKAEPPKCSRCNRPNAAYRIDIKPVCEFCVTLWERIKIFNKALFL